MRLLEEATALLDTAESPHLMLRDVPLVSRFFIDALNRCSEQALQKRVTTCLASLLARGDPVSLSWVAVSRQTFSSVAQCTAERGSAPIIQKWWRAYQRRISGRTSELPRPSAAHVFLAKTRDPNAVVRELLRRAVLTAQRAYTHGESDAAAHMRGLSRLCAAELQTLTLHQLPNNQESTLCFWLNIRNLGVLLGALASTLPRKSQGRGPWVQAMRRGVILIEGVVLSPAVIEHEVLKIGRGTLPSPTGWYQTPTAGLKDLPLPEYEQWALLGLWLPVRSGLPRLTCFRPETLYAQLKLNAEALLYEHCGPRPNRRSAQDAALSRLNSSLVVPSLLQGLDSSEWARIVGLSPGAAFSAEYCDVDWAFDPVRFQLHGGDGYARGTSFTALGAAATSALAATLAAPQGLVARAKGPGDNAIPEQPTSPTCGELRPCFGRMESDGAVSSNSTSPVKDGTSSRNGSPTKPGSPTKKKSCQKRVNGYISVTPF